MSSSNTKSNLAQLEDDLVNQTWNALREDHSKADASKGVAGPVEAAPEQSVDELAAELKRHPFFATSLDEVGEDNPEFEALKALAYEGTRAEIAENFREQGNENAKAKDWPNAKAYYTKALEALTLDRRRDELEELRKGEPGWEEREKLKESDLREKCLSNRSLCHLNLKNYRSCSIDCIEALTIHPRNVKSHYRLAQALLALQKLEEALKAATAGLTCDPDNTSLLSVKKSIEEAVHRRDAREKQRKVEMERVAQQERVLNAALTARQIKTRITENPPDLEDAKMTLQPDPLAPTSSLVLPVLVLYPINAQTDFIKVFGEEQTIGDHLKYLLPAPWDSKNEYGDGRADMVEAYLETATGGLVKWGKKVELLRLLSGGKVEVVDGVVTVNVVPKIRADEWIQEFKRRKGIKWNLHLQAA